MRILKYLLLLSLLYSLLVFSHCDEHNEDPIADSTNDDTTDNSLQDTIWYTLILIASEGGAVNPESGIYNENESVALLATPYSTFIY